VWCSLMTAIRSRGSGIARRLHPRSKPARALAAETLNLESRLHGLVNQAHRLTPAVKNCLLTPPAKSGKIRPE
jgi:hypothetical protein